MLRRKLMVCGYGRHGKDTLCEILNEQYGFKFISSSRAAAEFIFPELKDIYGYKDPEECFNDRSNHRKEWFDLICTYNLENPTKLAELIYSTSDIYCGLRSLKEFKKAKQDKLFDLSIWVDASERLKTIESEESNEIKPEHCDIVIFNNGSLGNFRETVCKLLSII